MWGQFDASVGTAALHIKPPLPRSLGAARTACLQLPLGHAELGI